MLTGRRFWVEFSEDQAEFAERIGAVCRAVWNTGLEQRREYRRRGAWMNYRPQARELAQAKAEHRWLAQVPGLSAADADGSGQGLPHPWNVSGAVALRAAVGAVIPVPRGLQDGCGEAHARHGRVKLPKLGWVTFRMSRPLDSVVIRSATVAREGRHWFVSLLVDDGKTTPQAHAAAGVTVGVDRGVAAAIATSDGVLVDSLPPAGEKRRMVVLQRTLSRAARRGRNRDKTRGHLRRFGRGSVTAVWTSAPRPLTSWPPAMR